ncbi:hypothetical protein [Agromyces sp. NPDC049794]|uniref:hypothetical protein n=1 Tax=unclassified Agromyces TaxID=2639701 RepID=UPI0033CF2AC3
MTTHEPRTDERAGYPPPALTAAVVGLLAVVLAVCAVIAIMETSARARASYTPVEVTVVDEHTEERVVADRRGSIREPTRVVSVELPDGARTDLRSDDLAVGTTATVYRADSGGVFETPPARPGLFEWSLCAATVAATVGLAVASIRSIRRVLRSRSPS